MRAKRVRLTVVLTATALAVKGSESVLIRQVVDIDHCLPGTLGDTIVPVHNVVVGQFQVKAGHLATRSAGVRQTGCKFTGTDYLDQ